MTKEIMLSNLTYTFKEEFDVNLTVEYENDKWEEWHVIREFLSNAIDSVDGDVSKIKITSSSGHIHIADFAGGFPISFAKRIGATTKKDNQAAIGFFGEGTKLSSLTCIRKNIKIQMCSKNWMIVPKLKEIDNHKVLIYDIYESTEPINGSLIVIEETEAISNIIGNIPEYFLQYNVTNQLFGDLSEGIFKKINEVARLYNKGVYIKDIKGIFSYAVSIEKLNRDRDVIYAGDIGYLIRNIWQEVDDKALISLYLKTASELYNTKNEYIEFYSTFYTDHPNVWADVFEELYGETARLYTNELAEREAIILGYDVIKLPYDIAEVLKGAGIKSDSDGLADDYEFELATMLDYSEKKLVELLPRLASLVGYETPNDIKVFENYINHSDVLGLYKPDNGHVYLKREVLRQDAENALETFLHEVNHHATQSDDYSREFAEGLCKKLSFMTLRFAQEVGEEIEIEFSKKGLVLPDELKLSSGNMNILVAVVTDQILVYIAGRRMLIPLKKPIEKAVLLNNSKVQISNNRFILILSSSLLEELQKQKIDKCYLSMNK